MTREDKTKEELLEEIALLRSSSEQRQAMLDASPAMIFYKDKENRCVRVNEAFARANGMSMEEMEGKTMWDLYPREAAEHYWQDDKEVMASGNPKLNIVEDMKTPHGIMWVETSKIPLRGPKGEIVGIVGFALDITDRRRAEEALRSSEAQIRALVDNIGLGITYIDKDYKVIFTNKTQGDLFRRPPAEFAGKHCFFAFEKRDDICLHCPGKIAMATGRKAQVESTGRRQDGSSFPVHIVAFPFFLQDGKVAGFIEVVEDVTERRRAEKELQKSAEMVQLLLYSTAEAIYGLDRNGLCSFVNAACLKILGYERPEELLGKNMHDLIHSKHADGTLYEIAHCPIFKAFREEQEIHVDNEVFWRRDGTSFSAEYWSHPIRQENKVVGAVVTFLDITERRQTEKELKQKLKELEQFNKIAVGRELKMIELKEKLKALEEGKQ